MKRTLHAPRAFTILRILSGGSIFIATLQFIAFLYLLFFGTFQRTTPDMPNWETVRYAFSFQVIAFQFTKLFINILVNGGIINRNKWAYIIQSIISVAVLLFYFIQNIVNPVEKSDVILIISAVLHLNLLFFNYRNFFTNEEDNQ